MLLRFSQTSGKLAAVAPLLGAKHGRGKGTVWLCLATLAITLLAFAPASAGCTGINSKTKQRQAVQEIYRSSSHPKRYFAEFDPRPQNGTPDHHLLRPLQLGAWLLQKLRQESRMLPPGRLSQRDRSQLLRLAAYAAIAKRVEGAAELHHLKRREQ